MCGVWFLSAGLFGVTVFLMTQHRYFDPVDEKDRVKADPLLLSAGGYITDEILNIFKSKKELKHELTKLVAYFYAEETKVIEVGPGKMMGSPIMGYKISPPQDSRSTRRGGRRYRKRNKTSSSGSNTNSPGTNVDSKYDPHEHELRSILENSYN
jgi:hypothetical protein